MADCESCYYEEECQSNSTFIILHTIKSNQDLNGNRNLIAQCPYKKFGCKEILPPESSEQSHHSHHIKNCSYRPIKCYQTNITECNGKEVNYNLNSILNHLMEEHKVSIDRNHDDFSPSHGWAKIYINAGSDGQNKIVCPGTVMECVYKYKGRYFFKNCRVENGFRFWWFSILGSEEQARKYRACLRIKKLDTGKHNVRVPQWVLPVVSVRRTFAEVLKSKKFASFKLSLKSLEPYSTCDITDSSNNDVHNCKFYTWCTEVEILTS